LDYPADSPFEMLGKPPDRDFPLDNTVSEPVSSRFSEWIPGGADAFTERENQETSGTVLEEMLGSLEDLFKIADFHLLRLNTEKENPKKYLPEGAGMNFLAQIFSSFFLLKILMLNLEYKMSYPNIQEIIKSFNKNGKSDRNYHWIWTNFHQTTFTRV
jgi:hypothetical protein